MRGLDVGTVIDVISKGAAQSWQMENRWQTMNNGEYDHGFAVDWMRKDLAYVMEEAKANQSQLPVTEIVDGYYADVQEMGGNRWGHFQPASKAQSQRLRSFHAQPG